MASSDWDPDRHATGIDAVDEQHRRMFGLLADLGDAVGDDADREAVGHLLAEIEAETDAHFADEESIMRSCGFAADCGSCYRDHHAAHADFASWVSEIRARYEDGEPIEPGVVDYARNWIDAHVAGEEQDQRLGEYYGEE